MEVAFYVPPEVGRTLPLPRSVAEYFDWQLAAQARYPWLGRFNWTIQSYLYLAESGAPVRLVESIPREGIVVSHRDLMPPRVIPGPKLLVVCCLADRDQPGDAGTHAFAQLHVVQNAEEPRVVSPRPLWPSVFVPLWPQPGLTPRDAGRGTTIERVRYFGLERNLDPALRTPEFSRALQDRGLSFAIVPRAEWYDYAQADVALAIRTLAPDQPHHAKPASKLVNAWLAGVPSILGRESAYRGYRRSALDYLEAVSLEEVYAALDRLLADRELYARMIAWGRRRAVEVDTAAVTRAWQRAIDQAIIPAYEAWIGLGPVRQAAFLAERTADRLRQKAAKRVRARLG